jgi:cyclophilin family peptidyl-prolyl cis-trans isomerase
LLVNSQSLPIATGKHTVFGRISEGMKVIQRMGLVPTGANDRCERLAVASRWKREALTDSGWTLHCRPRDEIRIRRAYPETK